MKNKKYLKPPTRFETIQFRGADFWSNGLKLHETNYPMIYVYIWVFPKTLVPPNHPFVHGVFHYKVYPFWVVFPLFLETPIP